MCGLCSTLMVPNHRRATAIFDCDAYAISASIWGFSQWENSQECAKWLRRITMRFEEIKFTQHSASWAAPNANPFAIVNLWHVFCVCFSLSSLKSMFVWQMHRVIASSQSYYKCQKENAFVAIADSGVCRPKVGVFHLNSHSFVRQWRRRRWVLCGWCLHLREKSRKENKQALSSRAKSEFWYVIAGYQKKAGEISTEKRRNVQQTTWNAVRPCVWNRRHRATNEPIASDSPSKSLCAHARAFTFAISSLFFCSGVFCFSRHDSEWDDEKKYTAIAISRVTRCRWWSSSSFRQH